MAKKSNLLAKFKRRISPLLPHFFKAAVVLAAISTFVLFTKSLPSITNWLSNFLPSTRTALSLIKRPEKVLKKTEDRTNLLILGKGGAGHETPDLTDTIIFVSYHHPSSSTLLLSLPRDIWVDSLRAKINTAYYYGNQKQENGGLVLTSAAAEEVINQPVHYAAIIDFSAFVRAIDLLGGLEINVTRSFTDDKYPIPGKENTLPIKDRYESLHFEKGVQTMSGDRALKYVRSRNSEGEEGTDYARAARQQKLLLAFQRRLLSAKVLTNPQQLSQLVQIASRSVDTDIENGDITAFVKILLKFDSSKLESINLDQNKQDNPDGLLYNPPTYQYDNQWVLTGKNGSWEEIQTYVKENLKKTSN